MGSVASARFIILRGEEGGIESPFDVRSESSAEEALSRTGLGSSEKVLTFGAVALAVSAWSRPLGISEGGGVRRRFVE